MCVSCREKRSFVLPILFCKIICREVMKKCLIDDPFIGWDDIMNWGVEVLKSRKLKAALCKLSWSATVYNIWRQRNGLKHGNKLKSEEKVVQNITWEVRARIMAKGRFKRTKGNSQLCLQLGATK
jgi:hypothetical protein